MTRDPFQAAAAFAAAASVQAEEWVDVAASVGRVLAEDLYARHPLPATHRAAMDGFYVHPAWLKAEGVVLPLAGRITAGAGVAALPTEPAAVEVATGTALADDGSVVPREAAEVAEERVRLHGVWPLFANIRQAGEEKAERELLAAAGTVLGPWQAALLAAGGHARVPVRVEPRVRIAVTGDELCEAGQEEEAAGRTVETHRMVLTPLLSARGFRVVEVLRLPDEEATLLRVVQEGGVEVLVTTGGASVGRRDWVGRVAAKAAAQPIFTGLAMRPGGPMQAFRLEERLWLALPGNPLAVAIGVDLVLARYWRHVMAVPEPPLLTAQAAVPLPGKKVLRFLRGRLVGNLFHPHRDQSSASLSALAESDSWALVPTAGVDAGDEVRILPSF